VINGVVFEICYPEKTDIKTKWRCEVLKKQIDNFLPFLGLLVQRFMFCLYFQMQNIAIHVKSQRTNLASAFWVWSRFQAPFRCKKLNKLQWQMYSLSCFCTQKLKSITTNQKSSMGTQLSNPDSKRFSSKGQIRRQFPPRRPKIFPHKLGSSKKTQRPIRKNHEPQNAENGRGSRLGERKALLSRFV
jgi:hypothetical protein